MSEIEKKLINIIKHCDDSVDTKEINNKTDLVNDLGFDSISIIQLVVELENEFDIEINDEYLLIEYLSPFKSLIEIINNSINAKMEWIREWLWIYIIV